MTTHRPPGLDGDALLNWMLDDASERVVNGCVEWRRVFVNGYGQTRYCGRNSFAHRLTYALANGVSLESMRGFQVLHACDNPPCINPDHLRLGDNKDNARDMVKRGRQRKGARKDMRYRKRNLDGDALLDWMLTVKSIKRKSCIIWQGSIAGNSYGLITYRGRGIVAHKLAFMLANGLTLDQVGKQVVRHSDKCNGERRCINPAHLSLGTQKDNNLDIVKAGGGNRKLSDDQVADILREFTTTDMTHSALARKYGVTRQTIWDVVNRNTYKHLSDYQPGLGESVSKRKPYRRLTDAQVREVRDLYATGEYTQAALCELYGESRYRISRVVNRKTYAEVA